MFPFDFRSVPRSALTFQDTNQPTKATAWKKAFYTQTLAHNVCNETNQEDEVFETINGMSTNRHATVKKRLKLNVHRSNRSKYTHMACIHQNVIVSIGNVMLVFSIDTILCWHALWTPQSKCTEQYDGLHCLYASYHSDVSLEIEIYMTMNWCW